MKYMQPRQEARIDMFCKLFCKITLGVSLNNVEHKVFTLYALNGFQEKTISFYIILHGQ